MTIVLYMYTVYIITGIYPHQQRDHPQRQEDFISTTSSRNSLYCSNIRRRTFQIFSMSDIDLHLTYPDKIRQISFKSYFLRGGEIKSPQPKNVCLKLNPREQSFGLGKNSTLPPLYSK